MAICSTFEFSTNNFCILRNVFTTWSLIWCIHQDRHSNTAAARQALLVTQLMCSRDGARGTTPLLLTRPTTQQRDEGSLIDPPVSVLKDSAWNCNNWIAFWAASHSWDILMVCCLVFHVTVKWIDSFRMQIHSNCWSCQINTASIASCFLNQLLEQTQTIFLNLHLIPVFVNACVI